MQKVNHADFIKYLKEQWSGKCPLCGSGNWNIQAAVYQLIPYGVDTLIVDDPNPNIPVIPVFCTKCGNTILVSATIAGLVRK